MWWMIWLVLMMCKQILKRKWHNTAWIMLRKYFDFSDGQTFFTFSFSKNIMNGFSWFSESIVFRFHWDAETRKTSNRWFPNLVFFYFFIFHFSKNIFAFSSLSVVLFFVSVSYWIFNGNFGKILTFNFYCILMRKALSRSFSCIRILCQFSSSFLVLWKSLNNKSRIYSEKKKITKNSRKFQENQKNLKFLSVFFLFLFSSLPFVFILSLPQKPSTISVTFLFLWY